MVTSSADLMRFLLEQRIDAQSHTHSDSTTKAPLPAWPLGESDAASSMFPPPPAFSHFQPQPQPLGQQYLQPQQKQPPQQQLAHPFAFAPPPAGTMGVGIGAGDFELFGSPPQQQHHQLQPHVQPYRPCPPALAPRAAPLPAYGGAHPSATVYPIPIPSSASSASSHAENDYPPLPDLVADEGASTGSFSPPSPRFASPVRPALFRVQGDGSYRGERAASVPAPEPPRPMRRKTQESKDWPSFYSSGSSSSSSMSSNAYLPTPQLGQAPVPLSASGYVDEPASYATPTAANPGNPFDAANLILSPAAQYLFYTQRQAPVPPHTDHPLLPSEQSDLLDRVRRDLLDVDLSSIKGPLRALALSGADRESTPLACAYTASTPLRASAPPMPAVQAAVAQAQQLTPKSALLRSPAAEDALSAGTVSPQEAFLDYDEVDSRLHDPRDPLYAAGAAREFGVGVGASLFAPLPSAAGASPAPFAPSPLRERSATPIAANAAAATAPDAAHPHRRGPHPFSVPQNAVTWAERRSQSGTHLVGGVVDGDADDDDGDFGSSQEADEAERDDAADEGARAKDAVRRQAGLGAGFGAFSNKDVDLKPASLASGRPAAEPSEEERRRYGLDEVGKPLFGVAPLAGAGAEDVKPQVGAAGTVGGKTLPRTGATGYPVAPAQAQGQFAPPAPAAASTLPPPSGMSAFQHELMKQKAQLAATASSSGTSTPRRAAAASALAGLNALPELYGPASSGAPSPATEEVPAAARPARQRKRSRAARAMYGEESDEAGAGAAGDDDDGHESDASYHSSASSFAGTRGGGGGGPTPKRRRRAPGAGAGAGGSASSTRAGSAAPGSIRCDHLNADGSVCGVVFRRPYDLARHRETIHNESLGGEKLKTVKEWRCHECDGTFSRKDALIRHCRIRGHKAG
ncbi:hypothetical protein JCM10450v2_001575 [Rhodotorula kratochvilovae]